MLPTFVIGLREGLEATLIVSIVATFLRQRGRLDVLRWVLAGVLAAVALCAVVGVALDAVSHNLPQRQQEGLETVIGVVAVGMVTYMVVWMKRHSRDLKGQLDRAAGHALAVGSGAAFVAMAFLAVLREGLETVVFLLAAFNESGSGASAAFGAVLGILSAVALGYAMYRGGIRINLSRFFRATGLVLVLVAAGLVVSALHTAHEAGWLNIGQQQTVDLSVVVRPGSIQSSLLTGMLGLQPQPVLIEVVGWLLYLVPVGLYVAWPPGKALSAETRRRLGATGAAVAAAVAIVLGLSAPSAPLPTTEQITTHDTRVLATSSDELTVITAMQTPADSASAADRLVTLHARRAGTGTLDGVSTVLYRDTVRSTLPGAARIAIDQLAQDNGGRLPLGVVGSDGKPVDGVTQVPVSRPSTNVATITTSARTGKVLDVSWSQTVTLVAHFSIGASPIGAPTHRVAGFSRGEVAAATALARSDSNTMDDRGLVRGFAAAAAVVALGFLLLFGFAVLELRRRAAVGVESPGETRVVVSSTT